MSARFLPVLALVPVSPTFRRRDTADGVAMELGLLPDSLAAQPPALLVIVGVKPRVIDLSPHNWQDYKTSLGIGSAV